MTSFAKLYIKYFHAYLLKLSNLWMNLINSELGFSFRMILCMLLFQFCTLQGPSKYIIFFWILHFASNDQLFLKSIGHSGAQVKTP